ncbi:hypothetical protein BURC_02148 [Burkholderiaceae bacterium]|nr:hypothetical protein BURC_02148 [Burkholderiaceae bacterium]
MNRRPAPQLQTMQCTDTMPVFAMHVIAIRIVGGGS